MKYSNEVLRTIAMNLGNPIGNFGVPYCVSLLVVGFAIRPFKGDVNALLLMAILVAGSLLLATVLMRFYVVFNGKRILAAIEKDYGPQTRQSVYNIFAKKKEGDFLDLDIPGIARALRED